MISNRRFSALILLLSLVQGVTLVAQPVLLGASDGLYQLEQGDRLKSLLPGVDVRKIIRTQEAWYFLTGNGVLYSRDLQNFEARNDGLPVKTLKLYDGTRKTFVTEIQELKDLEVDPYDPHLLVTATKDFVFVSSDGGRSWTNEGAPINFPSIKAVAITSRPQRQVFVSHTIRGPHTKNLSVANAAWLELKGDLAKSDPTLRPDELSDILIRQGLNGPEIWAANSFLPYIYRYDWARNEFSVRYKGSEPFAALDSLMLRGQDVLYVTDGAVMKLAADGSTNRADAETQLVRRVASLLPSQLKTLWTSSFDGSPLALSELWLVSFRDQKPHRAIADGKNGIYLQTGFVLQANTKAQYDRFMTERNINMLTIDVKDDYGRLRYTPTDPLVQSIARTVNPLDIESFAAEMKAQGRYLVARIVVFKDEHLFKHANGKYAVWDSSTNAPWRGYRTIRREVEVPAPAPAQPAQPRVGNLLPPADQGPLVPPTQTSPTVKQTVTEREYYGEYWVDPYSEEVWEYNIAIAQEIIARGFDEVQFDYIRFPTDGENLASARYRWRDAGMDMESALMSFLRYARENVDAPIGIDIYGANGWYRSGVRTGQDVELLARYVDVILPMFYPSHFEQTFMEFAPAVLRPFRIYHLGTLRNYYMARKQVIIRPWIQAFFINVRYDRQFYNPNYVSLQVDGVRHSLNQGMTFWNNSGRYDDLPVLRTLPDGKITGPNKSPDTPIRP